jgi:hypothetical protein
VAKRVRPDLALLECAEEDPGGRASQKLRKAGSAHRQWKAAQVVAVKRERINRGQ